MIDWVGPAALMKRLLSDELCDAVPRFGIIQAMHCRRVQGLNSKPLLCASKDTQERS